MTRRCRSSRWGALRWNSTIQPAPKSPRHNRFAASAQLKLSVAQSSSRTAAGGAEDFAAATGSMRPGAVSAGGERKLRWRGADCRVDLGLEGSERFALRDYRPCIPAPKEHIMNFGR